ncbi:MAG: cation diffusion facilitator family transporter [Propionibacteriaceae bacterium]|jgi:cobalt-zinc-cadmium efflux system protein|nr:cation diffusion facilitator family transporter [Propionibacteriaceae bacterium]
MRTRLAVVLGLNLIVVVAQVIGSWLTGSIALLTDTAHALTDTTGLVVAVIAGTLMTRPSSPQRTWGFRRAEVIAALGQAMLLLIVGAYAAVEGIRRLIDPPEVAGSELLFFGVIGFAVNLISAMVLSSKRAANFNMRAAFLEVVNDALGSLGVIVAAIVITTTQFTRADAIAGLLIVGLIVPRAVTLIRETSRVLMEFTPTGLDLDAVRGHILALDHVKEVHDLHASTIATGLPILTAHVVVTDQCFTDGHAATTLREVRDCVEKHFPVSIHHSTIQIEPARLCPHGGSCSHDEQ